jgi:5-methylcytosine-specific restriction endonuclease McrA
MPAATTCSHGVRPRYKCRDCQREYSRISQRKNYDPAKQRTRYEKDRDAKLVRSCNNRARNLGIPGEITVEYWLSIKDRCAYCGTRSVQIQIEHRIPLSKGGTNRPENVQGVCAFCNRAKGDRSESEFLKWLRSLNCGHTTTKDN